MAALWRAKLVPQSCLEWLGCPNWMRRHNSPPPPIHAGAITMYINGVNQGVCWTGQTGKTLFPAIGFYGSGRMASLIRAESTVDYAALPPFDPAYSATSDLAFSNGMHTVTSTGGSHTMAVLSRGFGRGAMAAWEFTLDEDEVGNETVCFGKPIPVQGGGMGETTQHDVVCGGCGVVAASMATFAVKTRCMQTSRLPHTQFPAHARTARDPPRLASQAQPRCR